MRNFLANRSYKRKAKSIAEELGGHYIYQYHNQNNPDAHYKTTGPEIWRQMEGKIDYIFIGVGTGGTISGASRFLKEKDQNIKIVGKILY